jgi:hypothetical protein
MNDENDQRRSELANLIEKLLEQEEVHWSQRSRANWLKNGDNNTNYFHKFAIARKKKNYIKRLRDAHGNCMEGTSV